MVETKWLRLLYSPWRGRQYTPSNTLHCQQIITVSMDQLHRFPPTLVTGGASFLWQQPQVSPPPSSLFFPPLKNLMCQNASQEAGGTTAADELKQALLRTTLELESTRVTAQEELRRMESQALHLSRLLEVATRERDEARHALLVLFLHHGDHPHLPSHPEPNLDPNTNPAHSLAFDDGSDVAAAAAAEDVGESSNGASPPALTALAEVEAAAARRGLPEKGRLVKAVMGAGPLLQTLLLAGPLPQWRHPPPDLRSSEIPPVAISLNPNPKKEKDGEGSLSPLPASLRNSSSSSSSLESGSNCNFGSELQNATFSLKSV